MVILNAKKLTRGDVHRLLRLEPRLNGSFIPLLTLESVTDEEQQQLLQAQTAAPTTPIKPLPQVSSPNAIKSF